MLDLIKQRRRWAAGLFGLLFDGQVPAHIKFPLFYSVLNWTVGLLQHIGIVLVAAYLLGSMNTSPVVETWSATLGLADFLRKKKGFEVISKRI